MQITVQVASNYIKKGELTDKTAVVVDVLRASSTIITALQHHCDRMIPAANPMEAAEIKKASEGDVLLGGEMDTKKIQGFDLGNSPLEYMDENISDKPIIFSTADGSVAIKRCTEAAEVLIGAVLNAGAVAGRVVEIGRDVHLVCAGTQGNFSTDDILAAGCILDRIMDLDAAAELDDLGRVALKMYRNSKNNLLAAMAGCKQYEHLIRAGLKKDVEFCLQEDLFPVVPVYKEGVVTL
jgi:Phosphosulfolactate phosphohydrolase and related enzymes